MSISWCASSDSETNVTLLELWCEFLAFAWALNNVALKYSSEMWTTLDGNDKACMSTWHSILCLAHV